MAQIEHINMSNNINAVGSGKTPLPPADIPPSANESVSRLHKNDRNIARSFDGLKSRPQLGGHNPKDLNPKDLNPRKAEFSAPIQGPV
ncbi:hypothetical protein, partial [Caballeronia calidae]|uniref:hypothetical protein n=1 Tax=Caballeronia calidae TaxID=1777139 RepID=UPI000A5688DF